MTDAATPNKSTAQFLTAFDGVLTAQAATEAAKAAARDFAHTEGVQGDLRAYAEFAAAHPLVFDARALSDFRRLLLGDLFHPDTTDVDGDRITFTNMLSENDWSPDWFSIDRRWFTDRDAYASELAARGVEEAARQEAAQAAIEARAIENERAEYLRLKEQFEGKTS